MKKGQIFIFDISFFIHICQIKKSDPFFFSWLGAATKKLRLKGQDRLKGDERILGDSDFVASILAEANERLDRCYEIKSQGYTIEKVEKRVIEIFGVEKDEK